MVAWCRRVWDLLTDERSRTAVEVVERYADGQATFEELLAAQQAAWEVYCWTEGETELTMAGMGALSAEKAANKVTVASPTRAFRIYLEISWLAMKARVFALGLVPYFEYEDSEYRARDSAVEVAGAPELKSQAHLVRDIFGNPFRPVTVNPSWLTWKDGTLLHLARSIYEDRRFGDLPVLADALEEAGCTDPDILGHCRGPGPHTRGCWPVDLVLGKG
jgi:hypothetical protein